MHCIVKRKLHLWKERAPLGGFCSADAPKGFRDHPSAAQPPSAGFRGSASRATNDAQRNFSGGAKRWAIVGKEAFAIIETCKRPDYLVRRPDGFSVFTDHRNLRHIFSPSTVSSAVPKYTADILHHWSLLLMSLTYEIHVISGDSNVSADVLSRWGSSFATVAAIRLTLLPVSPQLDKTCQRPTLMQFMVVPLAALKPDDDRVLRDNKARIWLPADASELQLRVGIVDHFGAAGHRADTVTLTNIASKFVWSDMKADVERFVARCLHCASVSGGPSFSRPLGEALYAERPNELFHWDYLSLGASASGDEYELVLKDDASNYVWLMLTAASTAEITYESLVDWFAAFDARHS
ncbi:unnamed protein product [Phytophthora fragariaefolia]|uniref:Unnamed protein product n=1 Tax=Phytophthora fragariaefolia TaxID=1490495 RepID=A0A9W6XV65_9STRA|nr:unnamed protein product [Phytophthora fragariaefolia]